MVTQKYLKKHTSYKRGRDKSNKTVQRGNDIEISLYLKHNDILAFSWRPWTDDLPTTADTCPRHSQTPHDALTRRRAVRDTEELRTRLTGPSWPRSDGRTDAGAVTSTLATESRGAGQLAAACGGRHADAATSTPAWLCESWSGTVASTLPILFLFLDLVLSWGSSR